MCCLLLVKLIGNKIMKNISLKQLLLLVIIFFFLFGDFINLKKKIITFKSYLNNTIFKNSKKKGI